MSVLDSNPTTLPMCALFEGGTISWSYQGPRHMSHLDNSLIDAFYSCDYDNWSDEFKNRVKTILDAQITHIRVDPHPFADEILQIWVDYKGNDVGVNGTFVLYVNKIGQPGNTELVAYTMNDMLFTHSMMQSLQQGMQEAEV